METEHQPSAAPPAVRVDLTWTTTDVRTMMLANPAMRVLLAVILMGAVTMWVRWPTEVAIFIVLVCGTLLWYSPRAQVRKNLHPATWEFRSSGIQIVSAGTTASVDWTQVTAMVISPRLIRLRRPPMDLILPRRVVSDADVAAIEALATAAGTPVSRTGWLG
jgi:hypothetical protein